MIYINNNTLSHGAIMQIEKFNEKKLQKEIEEFEKGSKKLFISTDDTTVCWRIWGKGQPIIFLHGGYGSWSCLLYTSTLPTTHDV